MHNLTREWPWHETRLNRRTRITNLYRDALAEHAPQACKELDTLMDEYGQHWITGNKPPHLDPDQPMTAKQIADWTDTSCNNITNYIATHNIEPITRTRGEWGRKLYRLQDFNDKLVTRL